MTKKFVDDKIIHFESDVSKIQASPAQYISYLEKKGALHIAKELINNDIDECINPNSPGRNISVYLDEIENTLTTSDDGRGITFDKMELVCTTLQSGSKFTRTNVGNSAGQNGVGLCAANAMSSLFVVRSYRYGELKSITFMEGKKTDDKLETIKDKDKHGTVFTFKPSPFYLNKPCNIESKELVSWMDKIIHLVPPTITINLSIKKKGKEAEVLKVYRNERGLYDYVKKLCEQPLIDPVHFTNSTRIIEHDKGEDTERFVGLEVAFTFDDTLLFTSDSFCNFVNTVEGGVHVEATRSAITTFLAKKTRESLSEAEAKKLDITVRDAQDNLVFAVFVSTDCHPQFTGQTKEKLGNHNLYEPLRMLTLETLEKYFVKNPKVLNKCIAIVKLNAKARLQMDKAKKSVVKNERGALSDHKIPKLLPCNNRGNEYKEIMIFEGDSGQGPFEDMRDDDTQAGFTMKGVPLNTWNISISKMILNEEIKQLILSFGCNIGDAFDLSKLKYNKIIIMTDSDIDGSRICSLLCLFFVVHMPAIIENGLLYRGQPPLYSVKVDGKTLYVKSKAEFVVLTEKKVRTVMDIELNGNKLSSADLTKLMLINRQYKDEVRRLSEKLPLHPEIVEFIARYNEDVNFASLLKNRFPELTYDGESIEGVYDKAYQTTIYDKVLMSQFRTLQRYIHENNKDIINYTVIDKKSGDRTNVTLYQFFCMIEKYEPKIIKRFKGLGEMQAEELWDTTLDPNKRTLLRFTMDSALVEADKFKILHGPNSTARENLLKDFKINKDDLDN